MNEIRVPLPRLLDSNLREIRRLFPTSMSVTMALTGVSEASLTLADTDEAPPMHALVEVFTARGSMGVFRVTNIGRNYRQETTLTLRHGIDLLSDALWRAQEDFTGTMTEYLTRLLTFQTAQVGGAAAWQLGTCACASTVTRSMNYDRLSALLEQVEGDESDYCFVYDFTTSPWTVSLVAKPAAVTAGFRLNRNAVDCTVTLDDSELCNKLRLSANHTKKNSSGQKTDVDTVWLDYQNAASQSAWGVVEKVADIDVSEDVAAGAHAECDAWAARFLGERAEPSVQIEISGLELRRITGDAWDEPKLGELCSVALPEYGHTWTERVVSIGWSDPIGDPLRITVSLANTLPKFSETLAKANATARKAGRVATRAGRQAEVSAYWDMVVRDVEECVSGVGIDTLYETGIILDAHSGATIYSLMEGLEALNSTLKVSSRGVSSLVMASGSILDENGDPVLDEDGNVQFSTGANCLYSQVLQTADEINSQVIQMGTVPGLHQFDPTVSYQQGDMVLYNGNSYVFTRAHPAGAWDSSDVSRVVPLTSRVQQTESSWSATVQAVGSGGVISAATIAAAINDSGSNAYISADHVYITGNTLLSGQVTVDDGALLVETALLISGTDNAHRVSVNNGNVSALTHSVKSGGSIVFVGTASGEHYDLTASRVSSILNDYIAGASVSGNVLTLTKADGTTAVTFSKAAAPYISGGWASGVYTVTSDITPAAGSSMATTLYDLGLGSWTIAGTAMSTTYDIGYAAIVGGQQVRGGSTGKSGSITAPVPALTASSVTGSTYDTDAGYWIGSVAITPSVGGSSGTPVSATINVQEPVNVGAGAGWADAAQRVHFPPNATGTALPSYIEIDTPITTWGSTTQTRYTLDRSNPWVYLDDSGGHVARISITGSVSAAVPQSTEPSGSELRTVTVGTGGNKTYIKISATGYRNSDDYITIKY